MWWPILQSVLMRYLQVRRLAPCTRSAAWPQQLVGLFNDIPAILLIAAQAQWKTFRHQKCHINYLLIDTSTWGQMKPEHLYCPGRLPLTNRFTAKNTTAVLRLINFAAYPTRGYEIVSGWCCEWRGSSCGARMRTQQGPRSAPSTHEHAAKQGAACPTREPHGSLRDAQLCFLSLQSSQRAQTQGFPHIPAHC